MIKLAKAIAVVGLVLFVGSVANAASISYSSTIDFTKTDWADTLLFQQFNSSMGYLTSVTLDLGVDIRTNVTVTNHSALGSSGEAQTKVVAKVKDRDGLISKSLTAYSDSGDNDVIFHYDLGSGEELASGERYGTASSHNVYTSSGILAEFTNIASGLGYIAMDANTFTQTLLANTGGNTAAGQLTDAKITGTVTYSYTVPSGEAVPEPATIMGLLMGVGGLARYVRRRIAFSV